VLPSNFEDQNMTFASFPALGCFGLGECHYATDGPPTSNKSIFLYLF